ncbi:dihydrofolate reductase family protein [Blastococcus sp. TF02A-26]|uniref:dihydrofolate reductase family protein n=1 Tax=Blastococcus sp. TF02A-26 TaxID=2250577 RepID=UPI000DE85355|nr:dihydrofolate reductase family protein [Blastococcus sp. TF02A-26]RBY88740.1 deaminase [Blastococcus sp. TF02A-26]
MRAVTLYTLLSLDGVAEEPGDWLFEADDALVENLGRVIGRQDDVLLGRGTYDYWAGYWPTADVQPFADFINGTPKHVFTSRPLTPDWANTTVVGSPAEQYVRDLRAGDGGDIGVHGSITLARSLVAAGLVDELHLVVAPTLAGRGRRLFDGGDELRRAELLSARSTPAGLLLLDYRLRP